MPWSPDPEALRGRVAVVAGATRGAGRGIAPGFLRSEMMLEAFGVREENWREVLLADSRDRDTTPDPDAYR
jgi:NAD(P)-dependent dehydrogenase (short-subunit alcohol dehydrogenase family)